MAEYTVAIDAGHGGNDPGAVYAGRQEKDDVLRLAMAVGQILKNNGVNVFYVRDSDIYETPFKKATDANASGADLFVSLHRNSSEVPNQYTGAETLVYSDNGVRAILARNINSELEKAGFKNLGVDERPNLVVLKRTQMPAALVEVGFINNTQDNALFDRNFNAIANGIASGIMKTLNRNSRAVIKESQADVKETAAMPYDEDDERNVPGETVMPQNGMDAMQDSADVMQDGTDMISPNDNHAVWEYEDRENEMQGKCSCERLYRVQVGAYRNKDSADRMLNSLLIEGFPAFIVYDDGIYKVQVGAYRFLSNAIKMEERLRRFRYNTYITT